MSAIKSSKSPPIYIPPKHVQLHPNHSAMLNTCNVIIPVLKGDRCLIWFNNHHNTETCVIMKINDRHNILNTRSGKIRDVKCLPGDIFTGSGTLLSGVCVNDQYMYLDDVYYYKGDDCSMYSPMRRFMMLVDTISLSDFIYRDAISIHMTFETVRYFGDHLSANVFIKKNHPKLQYIMYINTALCIKNSVTLHEPTKAVENAVERSVKNAVERTVLVKKKPAPPAQQKVNIVAPPNTPVVPPIKQKYYNKNQKQIFLVEADERPDIYHISSKDAPRQMFDTLRIPSYQTSVFMNGIFRHIIGNSCLDNMEESDSEDDFENMRNGVIVNKMQVPMKCSFDHHFKKWVPLSVI